MPLLFASVPQLSSPRCLWPLQVFRRQPVSVWTTSAGSAFSGWASSRAGVPTTPGRASRRPPAGSRSICTGHCSYWTRFCTPCPSPTHSPWIEAPPGTNTRLGVRMLLVSRLPWTQKAPRRLWLWRPPQQKMISGPSPPLTRIKLNDNQTFPCIEGEFRTILWQMWYLTCVVDWSELQRWKKSCWTQDDSPGSQAESCCWFIRWPGSSNILENEILQFWTSTRWRHVDHQRSGQVRCWRIELYASSTPRGTLKPFVSATLEEILPAGFNEYMNSLHFNNSLYLHLDEEAAGPRPEIRVL